MKLTTLLLTVTIMQVSAVSYAQRLTFKQRNVSIARIFEEIEKQTGYDVFYLPKVLKTSRTIDADFNNTSLDQVMKTCLMNQPLAFTIDERTIVITKKEQPVPDQRPTIPKPVLEQAKYKVNGTVKDELGAPLPNVTVRVMHTKNGIQTNLNGKYAIDVEATDTLEFLYVGYKRAEVAVRNRVDIDITLEPESGSLNEIAVIGFGRQKKVSVVGAQATIKPEELKVPVRDLTSALAGRLAGVVSTQRGGAPGADGANIFIRGIATFASSPQSPLLVVDGVPDRPINNIDPEDVESFTILKDATATAVYGTRGANGVILINTKKGKIGKPNINVELNSSRSKFTELPDFIDAPTFMNLYNESLSTRGRTPQYDPAVIAKHASGEDPDLYPNVNWYDYLFNDFSSASRANLNVSGGVDAAKYYVSAGYYTEKGMFKQAEAQSFNSTLKLDRFNFNSNVSVKVTKSTNLELGINGFITNYNTPSAGVNAIFDYATQQAPHVVPPIYSNGQWPKYPGVPFNPYYYLVANGYSNTYSNTVRSNIKVIQELDFLTKGLSFSTMFAFDAVNGSSLTRSRTLQSYLATGRDANGKLITRIAETGSDVLGFSADRNSNRRFYTETSLNYSRKFGSHDVSGLFLFNQSDYVNGNATDLISSIPFRQRSLVGRVNYGYKDKYFIETNFGYSGSENFVPSKRFGFFPSVGAGWVASNEKFFEPIKDVVSYLKFRYTYGLTGNSNTGSRFLFLSTLGDAFSYTFGIPGADRAYTGYQESRIGSEVQWETGFRHNLGIEINFLKDDLQLIVELFKEKRNDILLQNYTIPYISGFTNANIPYVNVGKTANRGIDMTLSYNKSFRDGFVTFRGTFNMNENKNIFDGLPPWQYSWLNRTGHAIGQRFGYVAMGLFKDQNEIDNAPTQAGDVRPGDIRYKDLNGDGIISSFDQQAIGYGSTPRILYGLNIGAGYKGFDFVLFFQGAGQVDFSYNGGTGTTPFSQGATFGNMYSKVTDRWTVDNPNPNAFYPRLSTNQDVTTNYYSSTWWVKRADYIRLKSAEVGYTFGIKALSKVAIKKLRIYANGTNLLTFSKWKFWDPELGDGRGASYPNISTFNLGLRANFN